MVISFDGITVTSETRPQAWLANRLLGGGMSSRLFREVREKRGLAYSVGSHLSMLSDTGTWSISCGMEPARVTDCVEVISDVLENFASSIHAEEIERAKRQLEVQFRMGLDSVEGQMLYLGGRQDEQILLSPLDWLQRIEAVDVNMLRDWCETRLSQAGLWSIAAPACELDAVCDKIRDRIGHSPCYDIVVSFRVDAVPVFIVPVYFMFRPTTELLACRHPARASSVSCYYLIDQRIFRIAGATRFIDNLTHRPLIAIFTIAVVVSQFQFFERELTRK